MYPADSGESSCRFSRYSLLSFPVQSLTVLLLAAAVRFWLCWQPACIDRNGVQFIEYARQIGADPVAAMQTTTRQPGFAVALLATHGALGPLFGGDDPESYQRCGELLAFVGGVATCGVVHLLAWRLFSPAVALYAGLLVVLWPHGAHMSAGVLSDMPHLALYLLGIVVAHRAIQQSRWGRMALFGLVAGLAYLIKQEALGLLAAGVIAWSWPGSRRTARTRIGGTIAGLACFVAIVSPHAILVGDLMPNKSPIDALEHLALGGGATVSAMFAYVVPWWQTPGRLVEDWSRSGRYVISTLFLLGLFLKSSPRAEPTGKRLVLMVVAIHLLLVQARTIAYGESSERYAAIPLALSIPWAAAGLQTILGLAMTRFGKWDVGRISIIHAAGFALVVAPLIWYLAQPVYGHKLHYRQAGLWLRGAAHGDDTILAHRNLEQIMFYAGRTYPATSWIRCERSDSIDQLASIIAERRPAWFVDARSSHRDRVDEAEHFSRLVGGALRPMAPVESFGDDATKIFVFRATQTPRQDARRMIGPDPAGLHRDNRS